MTSSSLLLSSSTSSLGTSSGGVGTSVVGGGGDGGVVGGSGGVGTSVSFEVGGGVGGVFGGSGGRRRGLRDRPEVAVGGRGGPRFVELSPFRRLFCHIAPEFASVLSIDRTTDTSNIKHSKRIALCILFLISEFFLQKLLQPQKSTDLHVSSFSQNLTI